jgi:hypothetical protein
VPQRRGALLAELGCLAVLVVAGWAAHAGRARCDV